MKNNVDFKIFRAKYLFFTKRVACIETSLKKVGKLLFSPIYGNTISVDVS